MHDLLANPRVRLIGVLAALTLVFTYLLRRLKSHFSARIAASTEGDETERHLWRELLGAALGPACLLVWYYGLYGAARALTADGWVSSDWIWLQSLLRQVAGIGIFVALFWFFYSGAKVLDGHFRRIAAQSPGKWDDIFLALLGAALRMMVPILALILLVHTWPLSPEAMQFVRKLLAIALVGAVTWILRRGVLLAEAAILSEQDLDKTGNFSGRALVTKVSVLRKIAMVLITVFAFAAVLMMFDEVRDIGRSILASAGIAGIIIGFAAQRSLGNLFAGLQIALTQPVRIGDQVKIQDEVGFVEEITLTYVVVRIWDLRRLVVPLSYFIEQPVQNWTRASANMLSPVTLRVDFSFPVDELRTYLKGVIEQSKNWDKATFGVQVTNSDHYSMEIRILGSSASAGSSFDLQCELREKAIDFVHRHYPQCLPKAREEGKPMHEWRTTEEVAPRHWPPVEQETPGEVAAAK
ncbi:MAG TPA: mechanosensitive ion channel family protein [Opitutaceae bacterium]|nr:mechanosensitive ion channel family protein [Opitutaceae bacterium]